MSSINIMKRGCLVSQDIRRRIIDGSITTHFSDLSLDDRGYFNDNNLESMIQPMSFDSTLSNEIFILDTEEGMFRPKRDRSVYRTLLELPLRKRHRADISNGFEIKRGFTYLVPLSERIKLREGEYIKSSPKSSFGRLFSRTRLLADYNPGFDEVHAYYKPDTHLQQWLLIQSPVFNLIVRPGIALNQLRFFHKEHNQLNATEIREEYKKNPLLYIKQNNQLAPAIPIISDGLQIHLDLSGESTEGIVGLKTGNNPEPIDLSKKGFYDVESFFEPVLQKSRAISIKKDEHYLLVSYEVLSIPPHLSAELRSHSHVGLDGKLHFAGFADPGFKGDLVFEIQSHENMQIEDGMPLSRLDIFRTDEIPDKLYGEDIGSHYQSQKGPRTAKYFKPFEIDHAAKKISKLDRLVLVQDAKVLTAHRKNREVFEQADNTTLLFNDIRNGFFHSRYDCEDDELVLQPITYLLIFGPNSTIFSYIRAENIKDYGDRRLFGKHSIGVGGHIIPSDGPAYINLCLERELNEEVEIKMRLSEPKFVGTLIQYNTPVDRVHFGLVFTIHADEVRTKESSLHSGRMIDIKELTNDSDYPQKYESWSKTLIPHLSNLYEQPS